jgi:hypothetical protein
MHVGTDTHTWMHTSTDNSKPQSVCTWAQTPTLESTLVDLYPYISGGLYLYLRRGGIGAWSRVEACVTKTAAITTRAYVCVESARTVHSHRI